MAFIGIFFCVFSVLNWLEIIGILEIPIFSAIFVAEEHYSKWIIKKLFFSTVMDG